MSKKVRATLLMFGILWGIPTIPAVLQLCGAPFFTHDDVPLDFISTLTAWCALMFSTVFASYIGIGFVRSNAPRSWEVEHKRQLALLATFCAGGLLMLICCATQVDGEWATFIDNAFLMGGMFSLFSGSLFLHTTMQIVD